ncbi:MAG TPA: hypothetical protein VGN76_06900 [Gemmatimonadales bacterium]|jgi:hypothetical protein|nr:hypothetical protein [Gemmatimonadales bacterium]
MIHSAMSWPALLALGAGHGINPAMGWLFAVALGLQRESRRAVWGALGPLAAGHALAIGGAVGAMGLAGMVIPLAALRWATAGLLIGLGIYRLVRSRHLTFGGMQVGARELAIWSFLMASAHGAGLMVLPLVMATPAEPALHHMAIVPPIASVEWSGLLATLVHTAGYLLVTAIIAVIVYEKVGVRFLRKAWVNLDLIWAIALIITGVAMVAMPSFRALH